MTDLPAAVEVAQLDVTLLGSVLAWIPERCQFAALGCDEALTSAIVASRPEARRVTSADASVDVVICLQADQLRAARAMLKPRGHLLLTATLGDPLMAADVAVLVAQADGGQILHVQKAGSAVLYLVVWRGDE